MRLNLELGKTFPCDHCPKAFWNNNLLKTSKGTQLEKSTKYHCRVQKYVSEDYID